MREHDAELLLLTERSVTGPLSSFVPPRIRNRCPHCHESFGSASLSIHVNRCRSLLENDSEESTAKTHDLKSHQRKSRKAHTLVDLCLKVIMNNFHVTCMDKIYTQPEHQAALIASLPMSLIHRIVMSLVMDGKQTRAALDQERTKRHQSEQDLERIAQHNFQLKDASRQGLLLQKRLQEEEELLGRFNSSLISTRQECHALKIEIKQLKVKCSQHEKEKLRSDAKLDRLHVKNEELKSKLNAAKMREVEAFKTLTRLAKRHSINSTKREPENSTDCSNQKESSPTRESNRTFMKFKVHKRPASGLSKIPYPSGFDSYLCQQIKS
ncbi:hypothetical protein ABG067_001895 [Albugo candida]